MEEIDREQLWPKSVRDREPLDYVGLPDEVSPELHPYILKVRSDCLAPQIRSGDQIVISPEIELQRGMIAAIFPHRGNAALKRLVTAPPPKPWVPGVSDSLERMLIVSHERPRRVYHLPLSSIEDVHAAIGIIRKGVYSPLAGNLTEFSPLSAEPRRWIKLRSSFTRAAPAWQRLISAVALS